ncbi:MAG: T9SS type A sorting domain-containing protein [Bacteroidetes bacterium]|nr:T9SS type A sorting domain-containing protein [Bacteroidota bacterium]
MPNGQEGLTAFSGVFQKNINYPFLNCVNIDSNGYVVNNAFSQYYNHYHCAHIPLFSATANEMHTVFFGGIAQYYDSLGILVQDNNVPFVKTIARVTRTGNGVMTEYKLPVEMPTLLGAGSEFIPIEGIAHYNNEVLKLDDFVADTTLVGHMYGGISSTAPNIFFTNNGSQSAASSQIFRIFIIKKSIVGIDEINTQSTGTLKLVVYPNPSEGSITATYYLKENSDVQISLTDQSGRIIENKFLTNVKAGAQIYQKRLDRISAGANYFLKIVAGNEKVFQKIIFAR